MGVGRRLSSISYRLRKTWEQIKSLRAPRPLLTLLLVASVIFLFGGGIYDILEKPVSLVPTESQRILYYYPRTLYEQFLFESLAAMVLYSIGFIGLLLAYRSTKYSRKPRQAFILLAVAILLITISVWGCNMIISRKMA